MTATAREIYQRHRLTVRDYQRMGEAGIFHEDDRVELIEGEIVDMAPIGSGHSGQVNRLSNILKLAVGERAIVSVQNPVILGERSAPQPDIVLLRPREDYYATAHPQAQDVLLIIEVADSSLLYDREVKLPLYAKYGIPEVWLVDVIGRHLTIYRGPESDGYQEAIEPITPVALALPGMQGVVVNLEALF
jgi:Uma2 family endonuclease